MLPLIIYLVIINLVTACLFSYDKHCAKHNKRRIPEQVLHICELGGGVFSVIPLMYLIHHKNRKSSYFIYTYVVLIVWIVGLITYYYLKTKALI